MKTVIVAVVLLLLCVIAMGVKVLFIKGGRFPKGHAHELPGLTKRTLRGH